MFGVVVKTTEGMLGFYSYLFDTEEDRAAFVKRPDIWWYQYHDAEDWDWKPGGAQRKVDNLALPPFPEPPQLPGGIPQGILVEPRPRMDFSGYTAELEDEDDDRWG